METASCRRFPRTGPPERVASMKLCRNGRLYGLRRMFRLCRQCGLLVVAMGYNGSPPRATCQQFLSLGQCMGRLRCRGTTLPGPIRGFVPLWGDVSCVSLVSGAASRKMETFRGAIRLFAPLLRPFLLGPVEAWSPKKSILSETFLGVASSVSGKHEPPPCNPVCRRR